MGRLERYVNTRNIVGSDLDSFLYGFLLCGGILENDAVVFNCYKRELLSWVRNFLRWHKIPYEETEGIFIIPANDRNWFYRPVYELCTDIHPYGFYMLWAFTGDGYEIPFDGDLSKEFGAVTGINMIFKKGRLIMDDTMYKSFYYLNAVKGLRNIW